MERAARIVGAAAIRTGFWKSPRRMLPTSIHFLPGRIDGLSALRKYYAELRGQIFIDSNEIVDPEVKVQGEIAILTYCFVSRGGGDEMRWNTTEVYRRGIDGWRIVHTHWSFTQPVLASLQA